MAGSALLGTELGVVAKVRSLFRLFKQEPGLSSAVQASAIETLQRPSAWLWANQRCTRASYISYALYSPFPDSASPTSSLSHLSSQTLPLAFISTRALWRIAADMFLAARRSVAWQIVLPELLLRPAGYSAAVTASMHSHRCSIRLRIYFHRILLARSELG